MRYHHTHVRITIIKKTRDNYIGKDVEKGNLFTLGGTVNPCRHYRKQYGGFLKNKNGTIIRSSIPTSRYISKENENRMFKRYQHSHVYCSIIHNSQEVETT